MTIFLKAPNTDLANLRIELVQDSAKFIDHLTLRYRAYLSDNAIEPSKPEIFVDRYDFQKTSVLFGVVDQIGRTVGSVRFSMQPPRSVCPADFSSSSEFIVYGDVFQDLPDAERIIVTGARFSIEPDHKQRRQIALILMQALARASRAVRARWAVLAARGNHIRFYQRMMMMTTQTEPRPMPGLSYSYALMMTDVDEVVDQVIASHPASYRQFFQDHAPDWEDRVRRAAEPMLGLEAA